MGLTTPCPTIYKIPHCQDVTILEVMLLLTDYEWYSNWCYPGLFCSPYNFEERDGINLHTVEISAYAEGGTERS